MIIVQLMGGLGNQLFQYGIGRALSLKNDCSLKFDISFFEDYEWHEYSLKPFAINVPIATSDEIKGFKKKEQSLIYKALRQIPGKGKIFVTEVNMLYNPEYTTIRSPAYLSGYWQCEKYFLKCEDVIRTDLQIVTPASGPNNEVLNLIRQHNSVSLHIRRGNYVSVSEFNKILGTCSLEYYTDALLYINGIISNPLIFVFSDEISWAKENLPSNYEYIFVDINDAAHDYEDLRLMQNCNHHIIANSTFSWWGAWLNDYKEKIVIAPKRWFADKEKNKNAALLVPDKWLRF